jgi:uncharacterized membrane protein
MELSLIRSLMDKEFYEMNIVVLVALIDYSARMYVRSSSPLTLL